MDLHTTHPAHSSGSNGEVVVVLRVLRPKSRFSTLAWYPRTGPWWSFGRRVVITGGPWRCPRPNPGPAGWAAGGEPDGDRKFSSRTSSHRRCCSCHSHGSSLSSLGADSLGALILIYPRVTFPFCTWLVMGFLRSVPWDIVEQAMIDGYSRLEVILKVRRA